MGQRPAREGIPLGHGPAADRRHLQRRASRSRIAGRTRCRASRRSGCGSPKAPPTACGPWVTKFSGVLYDRRWLPIVERIYDWHYRHERYLRNEAPLARVGAAATPSRPRRYHPGVAAGRPRRRSRARHVSRAHRSARAVRAGARGVSDTPDRLDRFKLLILADAAALSDAQCAAIRALRRARRQPARDVRDSLYDECGTAPRRTSAWPTCSASRSTAASTGRCRTRI